MIVIATCPAYHTYEHEIKYGWFSVISLRIRLFRWGKQHEHCKETWYSDGVETHRNTDIIVKEK